MKIYCLSLMLFASLVLSGCARIATGGPEIIAQAKHDRRTVDIIANDKAIETDSYDELQDDELQGQAHVNVNAYNGAVLLTGETINDDIKNHIVAIIRVIKHVKLVHNNLTIAYPSDASLRLKDIQITDNLKMALSQIRSIPNFESTMVKVITENAVVYLMGRVHRAEGAVVINVVRHQPNIKQIITVFEYLD